MSGVVFLAGATGAIGTALVPLLIDAGYLVYGTTRKPALAQTIEGAGAKPVIVDVFDKETLEREMARIKPAIVVHQLTDLPPALDPARMADAIPRNARIRDEGTRNLMSAASAAGCRHVVAQSISWAYAEGPKPYTEEAPLDLDAQDPRGITVRGVVALEQTVLGYASAPRTATVLRYGSLYGPRTGRMAPAGASTLHVDDAANAALLAVQRQVSGIFNIAEDNAEVSTEKAKHILGWQPRSRHAT